MEQHQSLIDAEARRTMATRLLTAAYDLSEATLEQAERLGLKELLIEKADGLRRLMQETHKILNEESLFEETPLWLTRVKIGGQPPDKLTECTPPSPPPPKSLLTP